MIFYAKYPYDWESESDLRLRSHVVDYEDGQDRVSGSFPSFCVGQS